MASGSDVLFDSVGSDGGASKDVVLDEGDSIAGEEVVLCGGGLDLGTKFC